MSPTCLPHRSQYIPVFQGNLFRSLRDSTFEMIPDHLPQFAISLTGRRGKGHESVYVKTFAQRGKHRRAAASGNLVHLGGHHSEGYTELTEPCDHLAIQLHGGMPCIDYHNDQTKSSAVMNEPLNHQAPMRPHAL